MIGIIDLDMGNLRSVSNAVSTIGHDPKVLSKPEDLDDEITHLVLPGVGSYTVAMSRMRERNLFDGIRRFANDGRPLLGICLGMQLLSESGDEGGPSDGLGLIRGRVVRFDPSRVTAIPHVGWNELRTTRRHPVFEGLKSGADFYYVHSFHFGCTSADDVLGSFEYCGSDYTGAVGSGNVVGVQFHPEKSQASGIRLVENFCNWNGQC
jgi:glutamine amidotransferase